ncbi:MAG TPA: CPXCG motif-containing cysteine-rich protein [Gemmatimonadaceae bacterium]|nr:CPXCG motif-containing cysteine-rich protein [Gemmatimonadaceae bacterium]
MTVDDLDENFPLGDGTADTSSGVVCPYCGEEVVIAVDPGGGSIQEYIEDCEVCCNPWRVSLRFVDGYAQVQLAPLDE